MTAAEVFDLTKDVVEVTLRIGLPILIITLIIGLIISLFQALTQIQEMTLSFVPKVIAILVGLLLLLPSMSNHLYKFTLLVFSKISH